MADDPETLADQRVAELSDALEKARQQSGSGGLLYNLTHLFSVPSGGDALSAQTQFANTENEFQEWSTNLRQYAEAGVDPAGNPYTWEDWNNFGNNIAGELNLGAKVWNATSVSGTAKAIASALPEAGLSIGSTLEKWGYILAGVVVLYLGVKLVGGGQNGR